MRPPGGQVDEQVADLGDARRVEAVDGLVEDQDRRVGQQRQGDAETLAHPGRIAPGRTLADRRQVDQSERGGDPGTRASVRPAPRGGQDAQVLGSREVRVEDRGRDHRPDPLPGDPAQADRFAGDRHRPGVGPDEADQDAQGRRLAGAIRAEQTTHLAFLDHEVEPIEGGNPPVSLT